jgi:hypothetical protein
MWKALYINEFPSKKLGGILCVLLDSGRVLGPISRHKSLPFIRLVIYIGLVHDKFCLLLYNRKKPMGGGHSQNVRLDLAIASS